MHFAELLAYTAYGRWRPGIGDPTFIGWFIAIAYLLAAWMCWMAARSSTQQGQRQEKLFWLGFAGVMLALGINKQLDLQTWLTQTGRDLAQQGGWYEQRRLVQAIFIFSIAIAGVLLLWLVWRLARKTVPQHRLVLIGGVLLFCFVMIRAASFHHVDRLLGFNLGRVRLNHLLELGGIFWVGLGAFRAWRQERNSPRQSLNTSCVP